MNVVNCVAVEMTVRFGDEGWDVVLQPWEEAATDRANYSSQGAPFFAPPATQSLPGTTPDPGSLPPSGRGLVQFGTRVYGGPGELGTG
jgi:hypothetical protein